MVKNTFKSGAKLQKKSVRCSPTTDFFILKNINDFLFYKKSVLFVYLEFSVTSLEERVDLLCSSNTCIGICFSSLCAHLFRGREVSAFELEEISIGIRLDVSDELQVLTLGQQFEQFWLIDDLFASSIYQNTAFWQFVDQCIVDALLSFCSSRDVQLYYVADFK